VGGYLPEDLEPQLIGMVTGFYGGLGSSQQELCGAVSGAARVAGALLGRLGLDEDNQPAVDLTADYRDRFLQAFGYTRCARLREPVVHSHKALASCGALGQRAALILLDQLTDTARGAGILCISLC